MFQLQTVMTTRCNFSCSYCYMKVNKNKYIDTVMDLKSFKEALEFLPEIQSSFNYYHNDFQVGFFGGEPLLQLDEMLIISDYFHSIYPDGITTVPTNLSLINEEVFNKLKKAKIHISISYDGPYSNQRFDNGKMCNNSFIKSLMQHYGIKSMVSQDNVSSIMDNFLFFVKNDIYPGLSLVRDNIWSKTSINIFKKEIINIIEYIDNNFYKQKNLILQGVIGLSLLDTLCAIKFGKRSFSCFACNHGCAIFGNGDIYPCARFGVSEKFLLGNFKEKTLNTDRIHFLLEQSDNISNKYCQDCELYKVCNMGCFYSQMEYGDWKENKPIPQICELYKIIYEKSYDLYSKYPEEIYSLMEEKIAKMG